MNLKKILIAHRGEIAVRVIKACQELGIATVAVYSEVDAHSLHVQMADEALCIGPAEPGESYLNINAVLEAARTTNADAIHPGYGFLAENPEFVDACTNAGVCFIGPTSEAMKLLGDKLRSRETMEKAGIPIIPGMSKTGGNPDALKKAAKDIGYPVMLKASAGGGGKGMQIVERESELEAAYEAARRIARAAFGDDTIYIEKYIRNPRHVEFQILADQYGNVIHLFERECSIQRRHQKIIEESPSPALARNEELRHKMGEMACRVAKSANYINAGTVEFLLDEYNNFYFLEVNSRIQVEHPVTEMVCGIDLVKQQIAIANGQPLPFRQTDIQQRGHAIECRIYAEDAANNFLPSAGDILFVREPTGPWVRTDNGICNGMKVPVNYDPILSKLITWGMTREDARLKMNTALSQFIILGVTTQIPFLKDVISHPEFVEGHLHTHFIEQHFSDWQNAPVLTDEALIAAAIQLFTQQHVVSSHPKSSTISLWNRVGGWSV